MKKLRKIVRAVAVTLLLLLVVLPAGVYVVISTPWAQEKLREVACSQLSALLGTDVSIARVTYHPFNSVAVTGVRVSDDAGRPALEAARISARFELWTFLKSGRLEFDYAVVDVPCVNIYRAAPGAPLNIQPIIDRLKPRDSNRPPTEFDLKIGTVVIRNGRLRYDVLSEPDSVAGRFNPSHIGVTDLDLYAYVRRGSRERWDVDLESLSLRERSGFVLTGLSADVLATPEEISLRSFSLEMPGSSLALKPFRIRISGYGSIPEVLRTRSVELSPLGPARISTADLSCFVPLLGELDRVVDLDFSVSASVRQVNINRLTLIDDGGLKLETAGSVANLNRPDSLEFNLLRLDLEAPAAGTVPLLARLSPHLARVAARVGDLSLHGSGTGDMARAHVDLRARARGAVLDFKGTLSTADHYRSAAFDGHAGIRGLDLAAVTGNQAAGDLDATLDGTGFVGRGTVRAEGILDVGRLGWNGYTFTGITAEGAYDSAESALDLTLTADDPALGLELTAEATPGHGYKSLRADMELHRLRPDLALGFGRPGYTLSGRLTADLGGSRLDDFEGTAALTSVAYTDSVGEGLRMNSLTVDIDRSGSKDNITLASDYLNGSVEGLIAPSSLAATLRELVADIVPDVIEPGRLAPDAPANDFTFDLTLSNAEKISEFFRLPVQIIYPVEIGGSVDGPAGRASLTLDAPYLQQGDKIIDQTVVAAYIDTADDRSLVYATSHIPTKKGPMTAVLGISGTNNRFDTRIDWTLDRKIPLNGVINFSTELSRGEHGDLCATTAFNPGQINFGDNIWQIGRSSIEWCDSRLSVDSFSLESGSQSIRIDGTASAAPGDTMAIDLHDIELASIFETLEIDKALIGGRASGRFTATDAFTREPYLATDNLHVDSIGYNYCTLGTADVKAAWNNERKSFYLDADITNPEGQHSRIDGDIFAATESLDLNFDATHIRVGFMKPFMEAFTSDVEGYVSGTARLFGTFKNIDLTGDVFAEDLRLKIDFTNTWYTATDSIHIRPGLIDLKDITIRDVNGHTARLNGWLRHDYFHSPVFEFNVTDARDFLSYNVTSKLNPDWYGTVYGNGGATVKGRPGVVEIGVDMTTAPHSTFTFVLSDRLDAEQYSFITFNDVTEVDVDKRFMAVDDIPAVVKEYQARQAAIAADKPSDYLMDIKVDITPDAELIIVMDPVGGDRIRAYGSGDMTMEYDSSDNSLGMRGTYTLDRGSYNFTLQDIIIKDFTIEPGSSITFKGDPYSAELNLLAVYSLNANLSDLDESFTQDRELNRTNVPVQALLKVTGDMRQPDINFDLRFPTLQSDTYRKVRSIISTEDMMSRQIIYLLALNRFYTPDYMGETTKGNEIFSVAASTISSQISNMLGKLSDNWSIAPNLRSDRGDFSDVEVDVALSSRLLNNRLLLNGNFGYRDKSLNTNQFIGDFDIEYLLTPRGTWRLKAYNRYNDQNYYLRQAATTQGVGIMFRRDFDSLFGRRKHKKSVAAADSTAAPAPNDTVR